MTTSSSRPYHHGDLRNALARAAAELAASGGPDAVTIRGAARAVGVTPTAAYRHFSSQADLFFAAKEQAMAGMAAAMAEYLAQVPTEGDPVAIALERLISTGRGYVQFALDEPGVFRTCFTGILGNDADEVPSAIELGEKAPYALLGEMLDALVDVGYLDPQDRPGAEAGPWAAVHGLAMLLIDGPLRRSSQAERVAAVDTTLALVARGLATGSSPDQCR